VWLADIPYCHGPRKLDPPFLDDDALIADKVRQRRGDNIGVADKEFSEDVDG